MQDRSNLAVIMAYSFFKGRKEEGETWGYDFSMQTRRYLKIVPTDEWVKHKGQGTALGWWCIKKRSLHLLKYLKTTSPAIALTRLSPDSHSFWSCNLMS